MKFTVEKLADFVTGVETADVPQSAMVAAQRALLDCVASALGGVNTRNAIASRDAMQAVFGTGDYHPWFCAGPGLHKLGALFSDCAAASALDIDDGHRGAAGHPGAAIVPAALLAASEKEASGDDLLAAIAVGYEVALHVASARRHFQTISFASGIWTGFGVAAAISWLQGLDAGQVAHALAIASQEAPQNLPQGDCMASSVKGSSPWSTVTAYVACSRAAAGSTGSLDLLDRPEVYEVDSIASDLGRKWMIEDSYYKLYAACRYGHSVIDAILHLKTEHRIAPADIQTIRIEIFAEAAKLPNSLEPSSLEDAQFSLPFMAALAAVKGEGAFRPMTEDVLADADIRALAAGVQITYPAALRGQFPALTPTKVTIETSGASWAHVVEAPLGDPSNPVSDDDIRLKLTDLGRDTLTKTDIETLVEELGNVRARNSREIHRLLQNLHSFPKPMP